MVFTIWLCAGGCTDSEQQAAGLALVAPEARWQNNEWVVHAGLDVNLSPAALEALNNGVILVLNVQTHVARKRWLGDRQANTRNHRLEIRYLPLSRHYQLSNLKQDTHQSYPRLWMLLAALENPLVFDTGLTGTELARGQNRDSWQIRARVRLDISRLPPPMRLPAWFSGQWRLGSPWHRWEIAEGAAGP